MAEWKAQINYNYNQSYHAYAYSLMYQGGSDQNHVNLSSWPDPGISDVGNNYTPGRGYYVPAAAAPRSPESPPESPEPRAYGGHGHYHGTGMGYVDETEASRLLLTEQPHEHEGRLTGSDSASDSEPQTSPDSWSSTSSGEGCLPQTEPATWAQKSHLDNETTSSRSPDTDPGTTVKPDTQTYSGLSGEGANDAAAPAPVAAPKNQSTTRGKVRASFSESQMNALAQRFSLQRYLTPAEMKSLAELTGLTYKQVKTWFQNRRMKLRRHQKDNTWASERYNIKDKAGQRTTFQDRPSHINPYEGQTRPVLIEAAMKKTTPQNLTFYLAAMGGVAGSAGYHAWPSNAAPNALRSRPPAQNWPPTPDMQHFDYTAFSTVPNTGFKEGEQINRTVHNTVIVQGTAQ